MTLTLPLDDIGWIPTQEETTQFLNSLSVKLQRDILSHGINDTVVRDEIFMCIINRLGFTTNHEYYNQQMNKTLLTRDQIEKVLHE